MYTAADDSGSGTGSTHAGFGSVAEALRARGTGTIDDLLPGVYDDVDDERLPIARRSLWAHLRRLAQDSRVTADDVDDVDSVWRSSGWSGWSGPS